MLSVGVLSEQHMKLITAIINPFKLDDVRQAIAEIGVQGITPTEVRAAEHVIDSLPKTKIELAVDDDIVEQVIEAITEAARSGKIGDGFIVRGRIINII